MKRYTLLLLALFIIAFTAACSNVQAAEVDPVMNNTAVAIDEVTAVESVESQPEAAVETNETAAAVHVEEAKAVEETADDEEIARPEGWSEETHSKSTDPNYEIVFPENEVNTLTISIDPEDWQAMLDDMTALYGEPGNSGGMGGPGRGPGGGGPGMDDFATENPIWVDADIEFEGDIWTDVGVRFKGNSSLSSTWSSGSLALPFKLDFDQFEDENPAIDDQRFYGFKQLSLSNNYLDATFMRDTVAADIFEEAGLGVVATGAAMVGFKTLFGSLEADADQLEVNIDVDAVLPAATSIPLQVIPSQSGGNLPSSSAAPTQAAPPTLSAPPTAVPTAEPVQPAAPAQLGPRQRSAAPSQSTQGTYVTCPKGLSYDPYPGRCRHYVDRDGDGYCDYSIPVAA